MARRSGRRSDYTWGGMGALITAKDIGAGGGFGGVASTFTQPGTIMRIRGEVFAQLDAAAADECCGVLVGIGVFPADMVSAGAAPEFSVDGSTAEEGHWLWTGTLWLTSGAEAAVVTDGLFASATIDSKAMRRIKPNDVLAFVAETPASLALDQSGSVDIGYRFRHLVAL